MLPEDLPLTPAELTKLFKAAGYRSHLQAAKALGVDKSTIGKWCRGELKLSEESAAAIRELKIAPGAEPSWNTYLAGVPVTIATFKARIPAAPMLEPQCTPPPPSVDSKAIAEAIARDLADKLKPLKVDTEELAGVLAQMLDADGIALDIAGLLLPDLRRVVDEVVQKFEATRVEQSDTRELAKRLTDCVALMLKGLEAKADYEAVGAKQDKVNAKLDALGDKQDGANAKLDALGDKQDGANAKLDALGDKQDGANAKLDALGDKQDGANAKLDALGDKQDGANAKLDALGDKSGRWFLALGGIVVVGFVGLAALIVACTTYRADGLVPGAGLTRGGGVAEESARGGQKGNWWWSWGTPLAGSGDATPEGNMGERKMGRPMPHTPLPGQAVAPCRGVASALYGSCWIKVADQTVPCPPDTFQEGKSCYVPIPVNPNMPVGSEPSGQETPTREKPNAGMPGKGH